MAFQTAIRFPDVFLLEKIYGEEPLYVYTIDMSDVLTGSEISAGVLQKDYQFEKDELKNKLIEYNVSGENITEIFGVMETQKQEHKASRLPAHAEEERHDRPNTVTFLKGLSIDDQLITRIIASVGDDTG